MLRSVCIYASQLASCIGYNRFKKQSDALESVWQRVDPISFRDALARNGIKTQEEAVRDLMTSNDTVRTILVEAEDAQTKTSGDVARGYEASSQKLLAETALDREDRRLVDDALRKSLYTSFGNRQESVALDHVQGGVQCHPDDTFYRQHVLDVDGVTVFVGGKMDAISDDGHTIIELKNRINRLFYRIPMYEIIQVQAYLHVVPAARQAQLIECLTRDDGTMATNAVLVLPDEELWETVVLPGLVGFVRALIRVLRDPKIQDMYLQSRRRASLVAALAASQHPLYDCPRESQDDEREPQAAEAVAVRQNLTQGFSVGLSEKI